MLEHGIHNIYKPKGPTSHDIIAQLRRLTGEKRIGHAGTLDPLASGVLVVAIGREFTKQIDLMMKKEKEYVARIKFGETSSTDDEEGAKVQSAKCKVQSQGCIMQVLRKFEGEIEQVPPAYSAIKLKGKKAYELARAGKTVEMKPRKVLIKKIELLRYEWPYLEIRVTCGPGVYIRSLARDVGEALGVGAYLAGLERTRVGNCRIGEAIRL